jgi:tRNA(fMet)-specific endonuclease VapC
VKVLLDTDICVFWLRGRKSILEHFRQVGPAEIAVSIVTVAELRYGADCSARPQANHRAIDEFVHSLTVLDLTDAVIRTFATIKAALRQQGALLEDADLFIAATALAYKLPLVTSNDKHFRRIPGLLLEQWT